MRRMRKRVVLTSVAVAVLGLVAAILGFVAEGAKSKSFVGFDGRYCVYRSTPALGCGIAAVLFLLTGQAVLAAASGCFGRCGEARERDERKRSVAIKVSAISWALVAAATVMFLYGAWRNASGRRELIARGRRSYRSLYGCTVLKGGLFSTASVASVIAYVFGIAAYVNLETAEQAPQMTQFAGPGIPMAQPHFQLQAYPAMGYPTAAPPPPYGGGYGANAPAGTV